MSLKQSPAIYVKNYHTGGGGGKYPSDVNILHINNTPPCTHVIEVVENQSFQTYFQPIFDLKDHEIIGYEVLNRIQNANMDSFYSDVLRCHCASQVDHSLLTHSLSFTSHIRKKLFINAFPSSMLTFPFYEFDLTNVVLELSEKEPIVDYLSLKDIVSRSGLTIAMDDLGEGYSNLINLIELNPPYVKIDRKLISDIDHSMDKLALVSALLLYARERFIVIAEGIEHRSELQVIKELGIQYAQGNYLNNPLLFEDLSLLKV